MKAKIDRMMRKYDRHHLYSRDFIYERYYDARQLVAELIRQKIERGIAAQSRAGKREAVIRPDIHHACELALRDSVYSNNQAGESYRSAPDGEKAGWLVTEENLNQFVSE